MNIRVSLPDFGFIQQFQWSLCALPHVHEYSLQPGCVMNHPHCCKFKVIPINTDLYQLQQGFCVDNNHIMHTFAKMKVAEKVLIITYGKLACFDTVHHECI